jgi:hypothetical protein
MNRVDFLFAFFSITTRRSKKKRVGIEWGHRRERIAYNLSFDAEFFREFRELCPNFLGDGLVGFLLRVEDEISRGRNIIESFGDVGSGKF